MPRMPQVTACELISFLKSQGFIEDRQSGSHLRLWHEGRAASVTVPVHTGVDIGRGLAIRILKDTGFTIEDYPQAALKFQLAPRPDESQPSESSTWRRVSSSGIHR